MKKYVFIFLFYFTIILLLGTERYFTFIDDSMLIGIAGLFSLTFIFGHKDDYEPKDIFEKDPLWAWLFLIALIVDIYNIFEWIYCKWI